MTGIQMILTVGAFILLMLVIVSVNSRTLSTEDVMYDSNFGITATSIGASVIEDASRLAFDETTVNAIVTKENDLSASDELHIESGESLNDPKSFDDFDDYNHFRSTINTPTAVFQDSCIVEYVTAASPNSKSDVRTWYKKITVFVWSKSMKDTIIQSSIFGYWTY